MKQNDIRYNTGCTILDLAIGGGFGLGIPQGSIVNIVGDSSSGKTFLAIEMLVAAHYKYKKNLKWVYDDCESGFTFDTNSLYNLEIISNDEKIKSETVQNLYCNSRHFFESLKKDEHGVYIIDSLDGLSSEEINEIGDKRFNAFKKDKKYDGGSYQMQKAKFLSQEFFPQIKSVVENTSSMLIIISQTRDKINTMFKSQTRAGGRALDFYADVVMWLSHMCEIKKKERTVEVIIKANVKKNKTPRPFRKVTFPILFDYGIDDVGSNLDFIYDLRGKKGELLNAANKIKWNTDNDIIDNNENQNVSLKDLLTLIRSNKEWEIAYKDWYPVQGLKGQEKIDKIIEWIQSCSDIKKEYDKLFNSIVDIDNTKNRSDLIEWIVKENKQDELKERVIDKWEAIEQSISSNRGKKYGN